MKSQNSIRADFIAKLTTKPSNHPFDAYFLKLTQDDLSESTTLDSLEYGYLTQEEATNGNWCYNDGENYVGLTTIQKWAVRKDVPEDMHSKDLLILEALQQLIADKE